MRFQIHSSRKIEIYECMTKLDKKLKPGHMLYIDEPGECKLIYKLGKWVLVKTVLTNKFKIANVKDVGFLFIKYGEI